jgi:hypothetical protein
MSEIPDAIAGSRAQARETWHTEVAGLPLAGISVTLG